MAKSVFYGASISKYLGFNALHPSTRDYGKRINFEEKNLLYIDLVQNFLSCV